ncbi:MAG: ABC transporter substrate-binding protein [Chloroflexi bacterium]|nr:ABC transporter substrate-binding protein [Chloroflexota bacterium]
MKHKLFGLVGLLVLLMLVASCATAAPAAPAPTAEKEPAATSQPAEVQPTEEPASAAKENVFIYGHPTTFPDLDPAISFSNDSAVISNCYETLTFYNPPNSAEILSPVLATSWEANDDATEWTFHLREGVKFQDGTPFNAQAVKYSIEKTMELGMGAAYIWDPVETIEVVDDNTVKFTLSYAAPLDLIASSGYGAWIYSPTAYEAHDTEWLNEGHCVGTGPYSIESRARGSRLVMTRNDDYWGGWHEGQFDKIVFEISEDPVVLQQMIEGGTVDFTYNIPPDNLASLSTRDDLVVYSNPSFQNLLGLLNTQKAPLDNKLVRQALSYSFPYAQFIEGVMNGRAIQAHGPVPAGMWGHSDDLFQYHYDLDKAKELLTEAGYPDGGFDLLYTFATGDMDEQQVGEVWKADLAKLGIDLEVRGMTWESQWNLAKSGPENAQDIFAFYWWPDYVSPYSFLYNMFHSEDEIMFNLGYYRNPEYDNLIDEANALSGTDRAKASEMFIQAQKTLVDDAAAIFFYDVANTHIARADIQGYADNPAYPHVVFVHQLTRK